MEIGRIGLARLGESVLNALGAEVRPKAFLIGVLAEDVEAPDARHRVCIEPEDDTELVQLFSGFHEQVLEAVPKHELQKMFYMEPVLVPNTRSNFSLRGLPSMPSRPRSTPNV
ncbi:hypothetical protein [Sphingopyxis sp. KK2]|uniref:hypothetical protein n=1 Tax=Sphingopyxis sp. KK2 TaxID=1855727 RepID=UPI0035578559